MAAIFSRERWDQGYQLKHIEAETNGRHFADDIFKCIFLNEMFDFRLKFHWSLFPRVQLTIFQQWIR